MYDKKERHRESKDEVLGYNSKITMKFPAAAAAAAAAATAGSATTASSC